MQLMFQQSKIKLVVPQIQFFARVLDTPAVRTVQNCAADHGDLTGPVLGWLSSARCCATTGAWVRNAWLDSGYTFCVSSRRASWTNSSHFLREGGTLDPQVDSCFHPANMAEEEVAALVVYMAVACILLVLPVKLHLALCSRRLPPGRLAHARSVHSRCFGRAVSLGFLGIISMSPLYFAEFSAVGTLRQVIFWEPSTTKSSSLSRARGSGGVARVRLPGDLPPMSLSDSLHRSMSCDHTQSSSRVRDNNNNNTIRGGSVLTGEEPPPHSGELKHALPQAGGPTQSQLSRPMSSGHHISMEHRLRRKQPNSDTICREQKNKEKIFKKKKERKEEQNPRKRKRKRRKKRRKKR